MFTQIVDPVGSLGLTCLITLIPVVLLLVLLAVYRVSAWLAVLIGSIVTFILAAWVWQMPMGDGIRAYLYGSATGVWNVDWITFWGLMLFNTLGVSGVFENFRRWLISQGTLDIRVQTMLFAWAFGALLEGLVGVSDRDRHRILFRRRGRDAAALAAPIAPSRGSRLAFRQLGTSLPLPIYPTTSAGSAWQPNSNPPEAPTT
jgi:hypothetical protein